MKGTHQMASSKTAKSTSKSATPAKAAKPAPKKAKKVTKPSFVRFAGPYAEVVVGHREVNGVAKTADRAAWVAKVEPLVTTWFKSDAPAWHEHDDVLHTQAPMIVPGELSLEVCTEDEQVLSKLFMIEDWIKDGTIAYRGFRVALPPRDGVKVGVMAWERFVGTMDFRLPDIEAFDESLLSFEITHGTGFCDAQEQDGDVYLITKVAYDGQPLVEVDHSGRGKGAEVMFRVTSPDADDELPATDGSLRFDFPEEPEE
jgi:hypothetical protein